MSNMSKAEQEKEKIVIQLQEEAMFLSASEKREAAVALGCDEGTVRDYTRGEIEKIKKLPFALKLLAELKKIRSRQASISL